jgi:predicted phosphodiesterase
MDNLRTFSYPDARSIVVCGDIHGDFNFLIYKLCVQYGMKNTLLIVAGDCGFGFEKPGYYENVFRRNAPRLSKSNNWILMIRGNHDDPAYFKEERISHSRFRTVPDYSVVQACEHNIFCVGGAVSIDRGYRFRHDVEHPSLTTASYWADEMPVYDETSLADIGDEFRIDSVITHTAPSFCELISKNGLSEWAKQDPYLLTDCSAERAVMDRIFKHLKSAGHPLSHWYYGHFHQSWNSEIDGVLFSMLDIMEFKELHFE